MALALTLGASSARADVAACVAAAERFQQERDDHKYRAARADLAICGREDCPPTVRGDCVRWLLELDAAFPTVVVRVRDAAGADVDDARVEIDGAVASARADGTPISLDPGPHVIRARAVHQGTRETTTEQRIVIQTGEKNRIVELQLGGGRPGPTPPSPRSTSGVSAGREGSGTGLGVLPWFMGGAGVVALGAGGVFAAVGLQGRADLRNDPCAAGRTCSQVDVDRVDRQLLFADIGIGIGLIAIGVATYLLLAPPQPPSR
jgi:hypothetical protein